MGDEGEYLRRVDFIESGSNFAFILSIIIDPPLVCFLFPFSFLLHFTCSFTPSFLPSFTFPIPSMFSILFTRSFCYFRSVLFFFSSSASFNKKYEEGP